MNDIEQLIVSLPYQDRHQDDEHGDSSSHGAVLVGVQQYVHGFVLEQAGNVNAI